LSDVIIGDTSKVEEADDENEDTPRDECPSNFPNN
jgi:hypothetical protein